MAVLNVNGPFPEIVRLSVALSCRTRPLLPLVKPETVPPIVKGPVLEPGPGFEPEPDLLKLQPTRSAEVINTSIAREKGFMMGFMIDCRLLQSVAKSRLYNDAKHSLYRAAVKSLNTAPDSLTGWVEGGMA